MFRVLLVSCLRNKHIFPCDQNESPARGQDISLGFGVNSKRMFERSQAGQFREDSVQHEEAFYSRVPNTSDGRDTYPYQCGMGVPARHQMSKLPGTGVPARQIAFQTRPYPAPMSWSECPDAEGYRRKDLHRFGRRS